MKSFFITIYFNNFDYYCGRLSNCILSECRWREERSPVFNILLSEKFQWSSFSFEWLKLQIFWSHLFYFLLKIEKTGLGLTQDRPPESHGDRRRPISLKHSLLHSTFLIRTNLQLASRRPKQPHLPIASGLGASVLVLWTPIGSCSLQHLQMSIQSGIVTSVWIPWTFVGSCPLQHFQMPTRGGICTSAPVPWTSIGSCPLSSSLPATCSELVLP